MGNRHLIRGSSAMKSGPLTKAAIRHSDFETLKTLSLPKSTIGRRRSLLKTA